jgi:hypothetical protein
MTVQELIEQLQELPPKAELWVCDEDDGFDQVYDYETLLVTIIQVKRQYPNSQIRLSWVRYNDDEEPLDTKQVVVIA